MGLGGRPLQRQRRPVNPQRALVDDLEARLACGATFQQLGFATEEQVRLFKLSKERLMDPHPDRSDYRSSTHFLDGLAATVSRSSGACQGEGEDGSNDGANAVLGGATQPGDTSTTHKSGRPRRGGICAATHGG